MQNCRNIIEPIEEGHSPVNQLVHETDPIEIVGDLLNGDKFAMGNDKDNLLISSKLPSFFRYPSGLELPFDLLIDEQVANVSIIFTSSVMFTF